MFSMAAWLSTLETASFSGKCDYLVQQRTGNCVKKSFKIKVQCDDLKESFCNKTILTRERSHSAKLHKSLEVKEAAHQVKFSVFNLPLRSTFNFPQQNLIVPRADLVCGMQYPNC